MSFRSGIWTLSNIPSPLSVHSPPHYISLSFFNFCSHQVIQRVKELIPNIEINEFYQCMCALSLPPFLSHSLPSLSCSNFNSIIFIYKKVKCLSSANRSKVEDSLRKPPMYSHRQAPGSAGHRFPGGMSPHHFPQFPSGPPRYPPHPRYRHPHPPHPHGQRFPHYPYPS